MNRTALFAALAVSSLLAACSERTPVADPLGPTFELQSDAPCPASVDVVVRSWDEFLNAVGTASPGAVIGIDGMIEVGYAFDIRTPDLTITCATPGSGLRAPLGGGFILFIAGPRIGVEKLVLDASTPGGGAYLAHNDPFNTQNRDSPRLAEDIRLLRNTIICGATPYCVVVGGFPTLRRALVEGNRFEVTGSESALHFHGVEDARVERNTFVGAGGRQGIRVQGENPLISNNVFTGSWARSLGLEHTSGAQILGNTVTCGSDECLFAIGTNALVVGDNRFEAAGSAAGIKLEGWTSNTRVERNTIATTAPGASSGIAVIGGGQYVTLGANTITGPWANSVSVANLARASLERNRLEGPLAYGLWMGQDNSLSFPFPTVENQVRDNIIASAGIAGVLVERGCGNQFVDNRLERNPTGLIFAEETGNNYYVGNPAKVVDNGNFDCDGDGVADRNRIQVPSAGGCPATADVVVRSWDELRAAVAAASPGTVIAVDGMFEATVIEIWTPDVTITCATPGSGLRAPWGWMFVVSAPRVTIERLTLEAGINAAVYLAHQGGSENRNAEDIRIVGNTIRCRGDCVVAGGFPGGPTLRGALVMGNRFEATGSENALLFHEVQDSRVEGNTFVGAGARHGIRVQSYNSLIANNVLTGSWTRPIDLQHTNGAQVLGNTVTCGSDECLFAIGTNALVVADNRFEAAGSDVGIKLEGWTNNTQVERNTIASSAPAGGGGTTSGIAVVGGGQDVTLSANVVTGPWSHSVSVANLARTSLERNRLEGALAYGLWMGQDNSLPFLTVENQVRDNIIARAGIAGVLVAQGCHNQFVDNHLQRNPIGLIFEVPTGANRYVGDTRAVVDHGTFDCDGDGVTDPNTISGPGRTP